ncbi:hypothetical protein QTP86_029122, partial [Hemibagrus guttatus]
FVAELSRFLSDVSDNLPALAEASPLQSGPDDAPDPDAVPDMPDPEDVPNPDDEPDLADEPEPDALNLAGRPSPSPPPSSSPSSTTCPVVTTVVSMARAVRKGFKESYVDRCGPLGVLLCTKYRINQARVYLQAYSVGYKIQCPKNGSEVNIYSKTNPETETEPQLDTFEDRRCEGKIHMSPVPLELKLRQHSRKMLLYKQCINSSNSDISGKWATFDDFPPR